MNRKEIVLCQFIRNYLTIIFCYHVLNDFDTTGNVNEFLEMCKLHAVYDVASLVNEFWEN